ncbi:MAG: DUF4332 domain-containing protein [Planctomycetaceae bacterium]|nr:MAG: DUF4332 domain-containing protein [Planctomycetaceae bacterium]
MLLERVDIDSHGPLKGIGLGPFSHQLNVIQAPRGTGKTAWIRFLRDSLTGTTPAGRGLAPSQGRVVWVAADGSYHCHRQPDGTEQGKRWVTFQSRSEFPPHSGHDRARVVIDVPARIVDGIVTDTLLNSLRHVVTAAIDAGLDRSPSEPWAGWPHTRQAEIVELQAELARLSERLRPSGMAEPRGDTRSTRTRLASLTLELSALDARREFSSKSDLLLSRRRDERRRLARIVEDVDGLRRRERELKERIVELDADLKSLEREARHDEILTAIAGLAHDRMRWLNRQVEAIRDLIGRVESLGASHATEPSAFALSDTTDRIASIGSTVDRLIGSLEADQRHWLEADSDDAPLGGDILTETDQAFRRQRRRAIGIDEPTERHVATDAAAQDHAWLEDPVRRSRIDSLRRSERRRRLHELTDGDASGLGTHGALLASLRSIAATLHGIAHRLTGIRPDPRADRSADGPPLVRQCLAELRTALSGLVQRRTELATRVARAQRLPLSLLEAIAAGDPLPLDGAAGEAANRSLGDLLDGDVAEVERTWTLGESPTIDDPAAWATVRSRREATRHRLETKRQELAEDIRRTVGRMTDKLTEAETLRRGQRDSLLVEPPGEDQQRRSELESEIRQLQTRLANPEQEAVRQRYQACWDRLGELQAGDDAVDLPTSPLAQAAGGYLERLSGGRLRDVRWQSSADLSTPTNRLAVTVDGQPADRMPEADRFLAVLAVRLAAADELAKRGRPLPLVVETPDFAQGAEANMHMAENGANGQLADPQPQATARHLVAVLAEAASRGRQVIVLTHDESLAAAIARFGGYAFGLNGRTRANTLVADDANREFDIDWRQTFQSDDSAATILPKSAPAAGPAVEEPQSVVPFPLNRHLDKPRRSGASRPPFFLTVDSPIERAPSINAAVATRLRSIGVAIISQLLEASPSRLAERLGLNKIDAATIRLWQQECKLVCGVRGLRAFDARVLVGCGITHPRQVREIESSVLVERVEAFLGTDEGARILRAGTEQEIARLTRWLTQAKRGPSVEGALKFYLSRRSPVQDAPSIGPRMAERLAKQQIRTVDDLLKGDAAKIAAGLKVRQVDETTVRDWQQQAMLVCRVPLLRGHDAQLLVAAGITQPQRLAECEPAGLLRKIQPISHSRAGKRILRGGKQPDLAEVTGWIRQAQRRRELRAAS